MTTDLPPGAVAVIPGTPQFRVFEYAPLSPQQAWRFGQDGSMAYRYKLAGRQQQVAVSYLPNLPRAGRYTIEAYVPRQHADATLVGYHVVYYDQGVRREKLVRVNQAASRGQWVALGDYDLDPDQRGSGRVNVTDYTDRDNVFMAFAALRWVPASATVSQPDPVPDDTRATTRPTADNDHTTEPTVTNQDVINAFIVAAAEFDETFTDWISAVGLDSIYRDRRAAFTLNIRTLRGLSADRLARVDVALLLPAADLARRAVEASRPKPSAGFEARRGGKADGTTWGVHGSAGFGVPPRQFWDFWLRELTEMGIRWYKQCDNGGDDTGPNSNFQWVLALKNAGITPVIRYQAGQQWPNGLASNYFDKMSRFAREGVVFAEIGNEPNLPWEWSGEWANGLAFHNPDVIRIVNQQWVENAEEAMRRGVRPAYPALAPTDWRGNFHPRLSSVKFHEASFHFLNNTFRTRARNLFRNGAWLAVHTATWEQPVDFDPWAQSPVWDQCLRGYEVPVRYMRDILGVDISNLIVMSTEGGVYTPESTSMRGHIRLKGDREHAEKMIEMFDYIETRTMLTAMMPWCIAVDERIGHKPPEYIHDGWFLERGGQFVARDVVATLKQVYRQRKGG